MEIIKGIIVITGLSYVFGFIIYEIIDLINHWRIEMEHGKHRSKSNNNIADVFQLQTQAILDRITLLATETKEQKEARERKEEIEREAYKWIHGGGNSTHGPI